MHTSPLGVIPKRGRPDQWRLIMDLFSPHGHSINDGIFAELCSLHYASVDDVVTQLGKLAKMDIRQAYHNIPVVPADRYLLGLQWQQSLYIDQVLPFGLKSAHSIFSAVADALLWIMPKRGVSWAIHYIDDFLTIGRRDSQKCMCNIALMQHIYDETGLPIEPSKSVGLATTLVFLGIEIDSVREELRLPEDKLMQLKEALSHWRGLLSHAAKVVKAGRTF